MGQRFRIHRFIIIPVVSEYNESGDVIREGRLKPGSILSTDPRPLSEIAKRLESEINSKKTEIRGPSKDTKDSGRNRPSFGRKLQERGSGRG